MNHEVEAQIHTGCLQQNPPTNQMNTQLKSILTACVAIAIAIFVTGCASSGTNFDQSKVSQIKKGETTEADLTAMFGQPENRTVNSDGVVTLSWNYFESRTKGTTFIPYAGAFVGGANTKSKMLSVTLGSDGKVTDFWSSGGASEMRQTTQSDPKN
jgi:outer membrane protein assembly factor BamE (lipoprotein component of BamABCDE complex)